MSYDGTEEATPPRVRRYLRENYTDPDGTQLSEARLTELLTDHPEHLTKGVDVGSYANYVGDKIAEDASLLAIPDDDTDSEQ